MAKQESQKYLEIPNEQKYERLLTVSIRPDSALQSPIPWIRLSGRWLAEAGFTPRTRIRVRVMTDCLVITKE